MYRTLTLALAMISMLTAAVSVSAQRDYLTTNEVEIVREAQRIDQRIEVLVHAMDRRFAVINIDVAAPKFKERDIWGDKPEGTRVELLTDIRRIMQKAIDDIDNLADRPMALILNEGDEGKKGMTHHELFGKAVRHLANASKRYETALNPVYNASADKQETSPLANILEMCEQIIAALEKLPKK